HSKRSAIAQHSDC
ncbi:hypothetical protein CLOP_g25064, partial [Closterium sp. NIES-67]